MMVVESTCPYCDRYNRTRIAILSRSFSEIIECEHCVKEYAIKIMLGHIRVVESTLPWEEE